MSKILVSLVTPVYSGASYLQDLADAIDRARDEAHRSGMPLEIVEAIFVDDGAIDDSPRIIDELQRRHPWIRAIHLSRNFGQHTATAAGILHTSGDWIVTLDEDLQHEPRHAIPMLMRAIATESDIVYASSTHRVHRSAFRNFTSKATKALVGWLAGESAIRRFTSFRMLRGSIARAASSVATHDTYFDVVLTWFTKRIETLPLPLVDIRSESGERSGYGLLRLLQHGRRMLIAAGIRPLRFASALGILTVSFSVLLAAYIFFLKIWYPEVILLRGWASLIVVISFFGGLTAFLLGIALEYLSTVVLHILGKPTFFVVDRSKDDLLRPFLPPANGQ
ncbi:MAG TPA: glycosyltransferase [Thermoanaerobaculia bacterium]